MKAIAFAFVLLSSVNAFAQVKFLGPSGLNVEIQSVKIIDQDFSDVPWDATHTYNVLTYADLELTVKITDVGCGLEKDSVIYSRYKNADRHSGKPVQTRELEFFLTQDEAAGHACADESEVAKIETIKLPLVNGIGAGADADITYTYVINSNAGWGNKPATFSVVVNQMKKSVQIVR